MVTQLELSRMMRNQYAGRLAILYDRILSHRKIGQHKSDALWNIDLNAPVRSMKGSWCFSRKSLRTLPLAERPSTTQRSQKLKQLYS